VTNVEKAVTNVKGDNFMASLRILNGLKKANLITHPANASMRKILSEVLPLINGKIRKYNIVFQFDKSIDSLMIY